MKKWYESKTIWINVLVIFAGIFTAIAGEIEAGSSITFTGIANIILRVVTTQGITK